MSEDEIRGRLTETVRRIRETLGSAGSGLMPSPTADRRIPKPYRDPEPDDERDEP